jgi:voltage-gated potassium channel
VAATAWVRRTDLPLVILALVFLGVLLVPFIAPDLPDAVTQALDITSLVIWAVFAVDYFVRLHLSPDRWHYVKHHVPDLLIVLVPMLRPLRAFRLLRLLRLGASPAWSA